MVCVINVSTEWLIVKETFLYFRNILWFMLKNADRFYKVYANLPIIMKKRNLYISQKKDSIKLKKEVKFER